jgi:rhodanese-related sulfurtransferase
MRAVRVAVGARTARRSFATDTISLVDKETLKRRLEAYEREPFVLVDVREPGELVYGSIPRAINIPQREVPTAFGLRPGEWLRKYGSPKPGPDTEIIFHCRAGPRALSAAKLVNAMGYDRTIVYYGSFLDWSGLTAAEYPPPGPNVAQNKS